MGSDLWTVFQQPDKRQEATMQAVRKMIDSKQMLLIFSASYLCPSDCQRLDSRALPL